MVGLAKGVLRIKTRRAFLHTWRLGAVVLPFVALLALGAERPGVTLAWDAGPDTNIVQYRIYYGVTQGGPYTNFNDIFPAVDESADNVDPVLPTKYRVHGLLPGGDYYFVATAIDVYGQESDFSNEVEYTVPDKTTDPPAPTLEYEFPANVVPFTAPVDILLRVKANEHFIRKVEFRAGSNVLYSDETIDANEYTYLWKRIGAGAHSVTARVEYDFANVALPAVLIVVTNSRAVPYSNDPSVSPLVVDVRDYVPPVDATLDPARSWSILACLNELNRSGSLARDAPALLGCLLSGQTAESYQLSRLVLFTWCQADPTGAGRYASAYPSGPERADLLERAALGLLYLSPRNATIWLSTLSRAERETIAMQSATALFADTSVISLASQDFEIQLLSAFFELSPAALTTFAEVSQTNLRIRLLKLICTMANDAPSGATQ